MIGGVFTVLLLFCSLMFCIHVEVISSLTTVPSLPTENKVPLTAILDASKDQNIFPCDTAFII